MTEDNNRCIKTAQVCYVGQQELIIDRVSRENYFLAIPDDAVLLILGAGQELVVQERSIDLHYSCAHENEAFSIVYLRIDDEVMVRAYNATYCLSRYANGLLTQEKVTKDLLGCCCESREGKWFYCAAHNIWTQQTPINDTCSVCREVVNMRKSDKCGSRVMEGEYSQSPEGTGC